jgi:hypothetical protein
VMARHALGGKTLDAALHKLHTQAPEQIHWLLWPPRLQP